MNKNTMYLIYIHQLRKYKKHLRMYALCGHFGPTYDLDRAWGHEFQNLSYTLFLRYMW